jgi:hypothetical protein
MGSTGTGRFGNYRIGLASGDGKNSKEDSMSTKEFICPDNIEFIQIEDVAISEYFTKHNSLPAQHTSVRLKRALEFGRLVIETSESSETIGNLPTQYNYLLECIYRGKTYSGQVLASGVDPIPYVVVNLSA